ncbi:MAG: flagellar hook-associated protein FlgK, partial [Oscillospiraceae bacterium]|nr:flagellar hook-associated protein FlgK [Oscillospiraceae bacterium]
ALTGKYKQLFSFGGDGEETAANMTVNSMWLEDASYLITDIHKEGEGEKDTTFASNLITLFTAKHDFGEFQGTFTEYISFYTNSQLGTDIDYFNTCLQTSEEVSESVLNEISEVSGVSLDEEGIDMTQWTKAYNAMSRVLTAMDEALDKLINETGLVGR